MFVGGGGYSLVVVVVYSLRAERSDSRARRMTESRLRARMHTLEVSILSGTPIIYVIAVSAKGSRRAEEEEKEEEEEGVASVASRWSASRWGGPSG